MASDSSVATIERVAIPHLVLLPSSVSKAKHRPVSKASSALVKKLEQYPAQVSRLPHESENPKFSHADIMSGSSNAESSNAESSNAESSNAESSNAESSNAESGNAESSNAESGNAESGNAESSNAESGNVESETRSIASMIGSPASRLIISAGVAGTLKRDELEPNAVKGRASEFRTEKVSDVVPAAKRLSVSTIVPVEGRRRVLVDLQQGRDPQRERRTRPRARPGDLLETTSDSPKTVIVPKSECSTIPDIVLTDDLLDQTGVETIAPEPAQGLVKRWLVRTVSLVRRIFRAPVNAFLGLFGKRKK
ncbi:MAG: hypothetical protein V3U76_02910 [Granulosicoccus sp.]